MTRHTRNPVRMFRTLLLSAFAISAGCASPNLYVLGGDRLNPPAPGGDGRKVEAIVLVLSGVVDRDPFHQKDFAEEWTKYRQAAANEAHLRQLRDQDRRLLDVKALEVRANDYIDFGEQKMGDQWPEGLTHVAILVNFRDTSNGRWHGCMRVEEMKKDWAFKLDDNEVRVGQKDDFLRASRRS